MKKEIIQACAIICIVVCSCNAMGGYNEGQAKLTRKEMTEQYKGEDGIHFTQEGLEKLEVDAENPKNPYRKTLQNILKKREYRQSAAYKQSKQKYQQSAAHKQYQQEYQQSEKFKQSRQNYQQEYRQSEKFKQSKQKYQQSEKGKQYQQNYQKLRRQWEKSESMLTFKQWRLENAIERVKNSSEKLKNKLSGGNVGQLTNEEQLALNTTNVQEPEKANIGVATMQAINRSLFLCEIRNEADAILEDNPNLSTLDAQQEALNNGNVIMRQGNIDIGDESIMWPELYLDATSFE